MSYLVPGTQVESYGQLVPQFNVQNAPHFGQMSIWRLPTANTAISKTSAKVNFMDWEPLPESLFLISESVKRREGECCFI